MPGKLKAYKCIRKYKKAEGLRHQLFDLTKKMCLLLNTSSFLLFNVAFLGLYIIKYFSQVHNEPYCLPSNEMGFFLYATSHFMLNEVLPLFSFHMY